jgi:hypothetical protein
MPGFYFLLDMELRDSRIGYQILNEEIKETDSMISFINLFSMYEVDLYSQHLEKDIYYLHAFCRQIVHTMPFGCVNFFLFFLKKKMPKSIVCIICI